MSPPRLIPAHAGKTQGLGRRHHSYRAHPRSRGENEDAHRVCGAFVGSSPLTRGKLGGLHGLGGRGRLIPAHAGKTCRFHRQAMRGRAHPRSRGENPSRTSQSAPSGGSSPLTRGKQGGAGFGGDEGGLIPAHAGKTSRRTCPSRRREAHPRSRGENHATPRRGRASSGSSPLTRGKPCRFFTVPASTGLIPAHAGKTTQRRDAGAHPAAHPRSRGENNHPDLLHSLPVGSSPLTRGKPSLCSAASTPRPAHPRSRGENRVMVSVPRLRTGSSPLTRGKLGRACDAGHVGRLIPAHAGKTSRVGSVCRERPAHPRSRGENASIGPPRPSDPGSSPLTRGKRSQARRHGVSGGLIPAHAGKTLTGSAARSIRRAHPRSRGENMLTRRSTTYLTGSSPLTRGKRRMSRGSAVEYGSSPLTRGKPRLCASMICRPGLIPAHAGKTGWTPDRACHRPAHPRSRGENARLACLSRRMVGSSPLTRGKPCRFFTVPASTGLIPAHAGKTTQRRDAGAHPAAHPRSRGENNHPDLLHSLPVGSSPLTRGKRSQARRHGVSGGLIPAHAGKTLTGSAARSIRRAHPRSRGENMLTRRSTTYLTGSSPLTRGKRRMSRGSAVEYGSSPLTRGKRAWTSVNLNVSGLIPAHAGKTGTVG